MALIAENLCRCCHSVAIYQAQSEPSVLSNIDRKKDYSGILRLTLNVHLKPIDGPLNSKTITICDSCMLRIEDAASFRKQVIECEEKLQDMLNRKVNEGAILENTTDVTDNTSHLTRNDAQDVEGFTCPTEIKNEMDDSDIEIVEHSIEDIIKSKTTEYSNMPDASDIRIVAVGTVEDGMEQFNKHVLVNSEINAKNSEMNAKSVIEVDGSDVELEECEESIKQELMNGALVDDEDPQALMDFITFKEDGKAAYSCEECGIIRSSVVMIQEHIQRHLDGPKIQHICPECPAKLPKKEFIRHRIEIHRVDIPTCTVCGFKDIEQTSVTKHQKVHKKKRFKCSDCGLEFYQEPTYKKHLFEHNPHRPYGCSMCSRRFSSALGVQAHERIMHDLKR